MKIILATTPNHDFVTNTISSHIKTVLPTADIDEFHVELLDSNEANITKLSNVIDEKNPVLVLFNGHGTSEALFGHNEEVLISIEHDDLEKYKDRIIHALACEAAGTLGPKLIEIGTKTFIGYTEKFGFYAVEGADGNYIENGIPALFFDPAKKVIEALLEGKSTQESFEESQALYERSMKEVYSSSDPLIVNNSTRILSSLFHDYKAQKILGSTEATLS